MVYTSSVEGFDVGRTVANLTTQGLERGLSLLRGLGQLVLGYTAIEPVVVSLLKVSVTVFCTVPVCGRGSCGRS